MVSLQDVDLFEEDELNENCDLSLNDNKQFEIDYEKSLRDHALLHIERFFSDKSLFTGGKIPKTFLNNNRRIDMVMNYTIIRGVDCAYDALGEAFAKQKTGEVTDDIRMVSEVLNLLARSGVPQQYAGGMLCLYLELIEGVDF
jgi:hypothetical protein